MNRRPQIAATTTVDRQMLMLRDYALDLADLLDLLADILRLGGHDLGEDITDRYPPRTLNLRIRELDTHASLIRRATT